MLDHTCYTHSVMDQDPPIFLLPINKAFHDVDGRKTFSEHGHFAVRTQVSMNMEKDERILAF